MKKHNLKAILFIIILVVSALACSTLTSGNNTPTSAPPTAEPSDTPVPLPTEELPTLAPPPTRALPSLTPVPTTTPAPTAAPPTEPPTTPGGEVLFQDDFSNTNSGWDRYTYDTGLTDYTSGAYKISITTDNQLYWANPYLDFGDVIVEVETQKTSGGDDMQYGIICRHQDINNWYALIVTADGYAAIRKRFQGSELEFVTDFVEAPSLNTGNGSNLLRAECVGDRLALYVNGELAVETFDSDIPSGDVGLIAGTFTAASAEVLFDNFVVYAP